MNKKTDFEQLDKRMPYSVPDNFFADLERQIAQRVDIDAIKRRRSLRLKRWTWSAIASATVAASVAIAITVQVQSDEKISTSAAAPLLAQAEASSHDTPTQAAPAAATPVTDSDLSDLYDNLSDEDQEFINEVYLNDCFMADDWE